MRSIDLAGNVYGRLSVVSFFGRDRGGRSLWTCRCQCGNEIIADGYNLKSGHTRSCGCLQIETNRLIRTTHGLTNSKTYRTWRSMINRCTNKTQDSYNIYGARGITVCGRWLRFENFLSDMGEQPEGMSIDRLVNDGNYEPGNTRWATLEQQSNNKRDNHFLTIHGRKQTIAQWAREIGIAAHTLISRTRYGWSDEETLTKPIRQ